MRKKDFKLTIVTPFYNEEEDGAIDIYFKEVIKEIEKVTDNWEIVTIDDGSKDNTYNMLKANHEKDNRIKVLKLSRNFGKEAALTAGIDYSSGDIVIPMDADLQDSPSLIKVMVKHWRDGYDLVIPVRKVRDDPFFKKLTAKIFYWFINKISSKSSIVNNAGDFRLMDRKAVDATKKLKEYHRFNKGILSWSGFSKKIINYERQNRKYGSTKYNYKQMVSYALDGIFSFSTTPIRFITYIGIIISFISFIYGAYLIYERIFFNTAVAGYTSIMVIILFLGGVTITSLGIVGEYVGRIYNKDKKRPIYVIDEELC